VFSVFDAVLLQELPYPEPQRLVMVWEKRLREGVLTNSVAPADFLDWRKRNEVFEHLAAHAPTSATVTGEGQAEQIGTGAVSWAFFDVLGVRPALGRTFQPGDEVDGQHRNVVITHRFWQLRYGGDPSVLERAITLNGNAWRIVGVLPADFTFVDADLDLWVPLVLERPGVPPPSRSWHQLDVYARLRPEVSLEQAVDAMDRLGRDLEREYPDTNEGHGIHVMPARDKYVEPVETSLIALVAGVGLVLLIACANVANLLLTRATARRRELAVRAALGASRARLVTHSLGESLGLALAGGLAGVFVAVLGLRTLPVVMPERMSVVSLEDLTLNWRLLGFAFALSAATGLIFGALPALQASRPRAADALGDGGRGAPGVRRGARRVLVIAEVALAALTLVGAGLVVRSFSKMVAQPIGFSTDNRLTLRISVGGERYPTPGHRHLALDQIERELAAIPGVRRAGAIDLLPMSGENSRQGMEIEEREPQEGEPPTRMHPRVVTLGYFEAMEIALSRGRPFSAADRLGAEPVVIINETAARAYWPDVDPIGRRVRYGGEETWRRVVGIARDVRHWGRRELVQPMVYAPQAQDRRASLVFVLTAGEDPESLIPLVRTRVAAIDPNLALIRPRALDAIVAQSTRADRALAVLLSSLGALALLLAAVGIYGVMSHLVHARVPEIGLRMTLGARPADIVRGVLREGLSQALAGLAIGLTAGAYLMSFAASLLYEVQPWDAVTLFGASLVLLGAALAACLVPARRGMRVDPAQAMRQT
jgi:predicted permease